MQDSPGLKVIRSRRSCEPCRRKKVRCDGDRPICAFCRRLKQECTYKNRRGETIVKTASTIYNSPDVENPTGRLQALESKVDDLYGLLQAREPEVSTDNRSESEHGNDTASPIADSRLIPGDSAALSYSGTSVSHGRVSLDSGDVSQLMTGDEIDCAVRLYASYMHGQPLLLFEVSILASQINTWPTYLREIFMVSLSRWSAEGSLNHFASNRRTILRQTRRKIMLQATETNLNNRVLQALCLLILEEIADSDAKGAWMSLAVGARLSCMSRLLPGTSDHPEWMGANWSLYVLDSLYCSNLGMVQAWPKNISPPTIRGSHQQPLPIQDLSVQKAYQPSRDSHKLCINDCYSAILSVWSDALDLLKLGEKNRLPPPWADESPYRRIIAKLYDFETNLLQVHRVRHMRPDLRTASNLQSNRLYWSTWFSVQILFHAVQAMINHPVLHIAGISRSQHRRPPSFLQHAVDQLFQHSGWVKKLIDLGAEKDFVVNDPFIAHVTAIVATGWMFFINSDDPPLAKQAQLGFETCYNFVEGFVARWPHLKHNIRKLSLLRESVNAEPSARAPSVQASLLWSLFDYSSSTSPTPSHETKTSSRLELGVATQYLSTSDSIQTPRIDELGRTQFIQSADGSPALYGNSDREATLDYDLSLFDSTLFAGFQPSNFGDDFFADFGQL